MDAEAVRRAWSERTGEYSPDYYAYYGPNATSEWLRARLVATVGRDATVLELGCSAGRHLAHLHDDGFRDLWGVDINESSLAVLAQSYPALAEDGRFRVEAIEDAVGGFDDGQFDAVYSVETLQHLHPDSDWVFDELARVVDGVLVTVEVESPVDGTGSDDPSVNYVDAKVPLYYRDWRAVFEPRGFEQVDEEALVRDRARVFRHRR